MQGTEGDKRYHLPQDAPLITPERAAKGDVLTGPPCQECKSTGKVKSSLGQAAICPKCRGRGWLGSVNAATIAADHIRFAQVQVVNILNFLWEREIITDDQHNEGHAFEAWRNQHRVALGLQKAISGEMEETLQVKLRAYGFVLLIRRLSAPDVKAISKALDTSANYATRAEAIREQGAYIRAFANLGREIIPVRERITYLERASEVERNHISDEQLKILLDAIKN